MKTENKQYRLKRRYPSLDSYWEVGDIALYYRNRVYWNGTRMVKSGVSAKEVENNPDFWEEVKQPLFVTEDGVEYTHLSQQVWGVSEGFEKRTYWVSQIKGTKVKAFYHESNADEYIWRNKRLFSYEELIMFDSIKAEDDRTNELKRIAKERSGKWK